MRGKDKKSDKYNVDSVIGEGEKDKCGIVRGKGEKGEKDKGDIERRYGEKGEKDKDDSVRGEGEKGEKGEKDKGDSVRDDGEKCVCITLLYMCFYYKVQTYLDKKSVEGRIYIIQPLAVD